MTSAKYHKYLLNFKVPSGTSRGILKTKETWFLTLEKNGKKGVGECGLFRGLSIDDRLDYEEKLQWVCQNIHLGLELLLLETIQFPSIQIGLEQAFLSLASTNTFHLFPSDFSSSKQGQLQEMAILCDKTPLPIALDEELIGVFDVTNKQELLQMIKPQYIILKPSLVGGFTGSEKWIELAKNQNIGWWITSALESNVGLNAIAQWTATLESEMPQGLGTGSLFTNNFDSPLEVKNGYLHYNKNKSWNFNLI